MSTRGSWHASGSSPRVRGKQRGLEVLHAWIRIIPARAGQTMWSSRNPAHSPDHPRACGANWLDSQSRMSTAGSSPRVRGKHPLFCARDAAIRIIPARAGQTSSAMRDDVPSSDHPRACGANLMQLEGKYRKDGSSPRVRGKLAGLARGLPRLRIIPARAGQTSRAATGSTGTSDHPRACGANLFFSPCHLVQYGSSPRVRGKPGAGPHQRPARRIIPARAGQTTGGVQAKARRTEHPRACGAN